jgi:hypothetical protein
MGFRNNMKKDQFIEVLRDLIYRHIPELHYGITEGGRELQRLDRFAHKIFDLCRSVEIEEQNPVTIENFDKEREDD